MQKRRVSFPCGKLSLEGILAIPGGPGPFPTVICCHPHPRGGGSMNNMVVTTVCDTLAQSQVLSFKFNFRGVGKSQGEFTDDLSMQADVEAAIAYATTLKEVDTKRIGLIGYSAGAGFGLPVAARDDRIKALAGISPPLSRFDADVLKDCPKPKYFISGGEDEHIPIAELIEFCQSLPDPKQCDNIEGANHFWWEYETLLANRVTGFFRKVFFIRG